MPIHAHPLINGVSFEETADRLKVVISLPRSWLLFGLFTISLITWVVMLVVVAVYLIRDVLPERERYTFVLTVMMLVWLVLWYYVGRLVWNRWQYYTADREILFVDPNVLIVRRPVSILGITDAYDMQHVSPFYYNEEHDCAAFDYGSQRIYFANQLPEAETRRLMAYLNQRFFPDFDEDDA